MYCRSTPLFFLAHSTLIKKMSTTMQRYKYSILFQPSPTKRLRMQRDTSSPSDAHASPSPPGTTYQRASVCLGAVPGEIQYKIEGARVSHHQQQSGQPGIGRRRREVRGLAELGTTKLFMKHISNDLHFQCTLNFMWTHFH